MFHKSEANVMHVLLFCLFVDIKNFGFKKNENPQLKQYVYLLLSLVQTV